MKATPYRLFVMLCLFGCYACSDNVEIDVEKPSIDLSAPESFPTNCDTIYFDEPFTIKALLKDNAELGSYSIDIHNNFNQHTHSTEAERCVFDEKKTAINPFVLIEDYELIKGLSEYLIETTMTLPYKDGTEAYDEGDYHFSITVVDKEGWSTLKGFNIKILKR